MSKSEIPLSPPRDPLNVVNARNVPVDLCDIWRGCAAFLVLGGPSLNKLPLNAFGERGVLSLGINNVAGYVRTTAFLCSDPANKFNFSIWTDPKIWKFIPKSRMRRTRGRLREKVGGEFRWSQVCVIDCPSTWYFDRDAHFEPDKFLTKPSASWGTGKQGIKDGSTRPKMLFTPLLGLRLLHYLGVREVYCVGMDFTMSKEAGYAFQQGRDDEAVASNHNLYRVANSELVSLRPHLDAAGFKVYNCNGDSLCSAFPHVPFERALKRVRGAVQAGALELEGWYETKGKVGDEAAI